MASYSRNNRPVNLLPLMDVIFLVLAIFFYLMLFMVKREGIPVELPSALTALVDKEEYVAISLDHDNVLYVNKELVQWDNLNDKIAAHKRSNKKGLVIYISADKKSQHEFFVKILDSLRLNNITDVNIEISDN